MPQRGRVTVGARAFAVVVATLALAFVTAGALSGGTGAATPSATDRAALASPGEPGPATLNTDGQPTHTLDTRVTVGDRVAAAGRTVRVPVRIDRTTGGVAGYSLDVAVADTDVARIRDVQFPDGMGQSYAAVTADGGAASVAAVDTNATIEPFDGNATLLTLVVEAKAPGTTDLSVTVDRLDDDDGEAVEPTPRNGTVEVPDEAVVTVDDDGGATYRSLAAATRSAPEGFTIRVAEGTYPGPVVVSKNQTIDAADGAVVEGGGPDGVVLDPGSHAEPTIRGLTVRGFDSGAGILAPNTSGDVRLVDVTLRDNDASIRAGNALVSGSRPPATGDWTIRDSHLGGNEAIVAGGTTGDWAVLDTTVTDGVRASESTGDWTVRDVTVPATAELSNFLDARRSRGDWAVLDSDVTGPTVAVNALGASGDWRIRGTNVTDTGHTAVQAVGTTGDWTVRSSVVHNASYIGFDFGEAAGRVVVNGSAIVGNSEAGLNADGAALRVDATDNWWGRSAGPTVDQCTGNADCSDPLTTALFGLSADETNATENDTTNETTGGPGTLVVAPGDRGEYSTIQAAVDAADPGETVRVRSGTYREQVVVDKSIRIVSDGATLDGSELDQLLPVAFQIPQESEVSPTIRGFDVTGYGAAVEATVTAGNWTVADLSVSESRNGIYAPGSDGDWLVTDSQVSDATRFGINAFGATGDWRVADTTVRGSGAAGINAVGTTGPWVVSGTTLTGNRVGLNASSSTGNWTVRGGTFANNVRASVAALDTGGFWAVSRSSIIGNGIDATGATVEGDATGNWWGQSAGPTADQCTGNVTCADHRSSRPGSAGGRPSLSLSGPGVADHSAAAAGLDTRVPVSRGGLADLTRLSAVATPAAATGANWTRVVGGSGDDSVRAVVRDGDGYVAVGSTTTGAEGRSDAWLVRVDDSGQTVRNRTYGGLGRDAATDVLALEGGGVLVVGTTTSAGLADDDAFAMRLDADGDQQWFRTYGGPQTDRATAVARTADGYLLAGSTRSFGNGSSDGWVVRLRANGTERANATVGGLGADRVDGAVRVGGTTYLAGTTTAPDGTRNGLVVSVSGDGHSVTELDRRGDQTLRGIAPGVDGGLVVVGSTERAGGGNRDAWVLGLTVDGQPDWNRTFGGLGDDGVAAVARTPAGDSYHFAGRTTSFDVSSPTAWFGRLGADGAVLSARTVGDGVAAGTSADAGLLAGTVTAGDADGLLVRNVTARQQTPAPTATPSQNDTTTGGTQDSTDDGLPLPLLVGALAVVLLGGLGAKRLASD